MTAHSTKLLIEQMQRDIDVGHHRASESTAAQMRQEAAATKPSPTALPPEAARPAQERERPRPAPARAPDVGAFVQTLAAGRAEEVEGHIGRALDERFKKGARR